MKVALAHHWLTSYRGGERVLEQMASLFPNSDVYTLVRRPGVKIPGLADRTIHTSRLQHIPRIEKYYRHLLPLHPWAARAMRVPDDVNVLLSSDAALIKGVTLPSDARHVCYCHSPPRYLWELGAEYKRSSHAARIALDRFAPMLRSFDFAAAQKVTHFIANSRFVADRIRRCYQRESDVVYPPVATHEFRADRPRKEHFLVISELVSYKRIDIAVEAFNRLGKPLVVIGDGPQRKKLESLARPNIEFLGRQPFATLKSHFETASAFVFPGIEDFGITPVEAQAAGCPVIAYRAGGALETVVDGVTGTFFHEQHAECLAAAVERFDPDDFDPAVCRAHAERFSENRFRERYVRLLKRLLESPQHSVRKSSPLIGHKQEVA